MTAYVYIAALNIHFEGTDPLDEDGNILGPDDTIPSYRNRRAAKRIAERASGAGTSPVVYRIAPPES